jgi:hypothetical protein
MLIYWRVTPKEKFKSGNLMEARDYYREAIVYVEDLVDARRKERNELLMPLYSNLAQASLLGKCIERPGKAFLWEVQTRSTIHQYVCVAHVVVWAERLKQPISAQFGAERITFTQGLPSIGGAHLGRRCVYLGREHLRIFFRFKKLLKD